MHVCMCVRVTVVCVCVHNNCSAFKYYTSVHAYVCVFVFVCVACWFDWLVSSLL